MRRKGHRCPLHSYRWWCCPARIACRYDKGIGVIIPIKRQLLQLGAVDSSEKGGMQAKRSDGAAGKIQGRQEDSLAIDRIFIDRQLLGIFESGVVGIDGIGYQLTV